MQTESNVTSGEGCDEHVSASSETPTAANRGQKDDVEHKGGYHYGWLQNFERGGHSVA